MSHVNLIAADKELPLCGRQEFRTHTVKAMGKSYEVGCTCGFQVAAHQYCRDSVDGLEIEMKPFQYELDFEVCQTDLDHLLAYLRENLSPGEEAELWSLWVGLDGGRVHRYRGSLSEFDLETLAMLGELQYEPDPTQEYSGGLISQVCLTVTV